MIADSEGNGTRVPKSFMLTMSENPSLRHWCNSVAQTLNDGDLLLIENTFLKAPYRKEI